MNIACIAAAGFGTRMDLKVEDKQFLPLAGIPVIAHCVNAFDIEEISHIIIAVQKDNIEKTLKILEEFYPNVNVFVIEGGASRNQTIAKMVNFATNTLKAKDDDFIITHDAVRPLVKKDIILQNIMKAKKYDCTGTAIGVVDSVYISNDKKEVFDTIDRYSIFLAQTPQTFKVSSYLKLASKLSREDFDGNMDTCSLFHKHGFKVGFVEGDKKNIKITVDEDYELIKIYKTLK